MSPVKHDHPSRTGPVNTAVAYIPTTAFQGVYRATNSLDHYAAAPKYLVYCGEIR